MTKAYISPEGLEKLKKELKELKIKRQEIAKRIEEAKTQGDLAENAEYSEAKEAQFFNEGKISKLQEIIKSCTVITKSGDKQQVEIGSTVKVKNDNTLNIFTIVGSEESNPNENLISNESPLGEAFLDKKVGDIVEVKTPRGKIKYEIISIK